MFINNKYTMVVNQLFIEIPPLNIIIKILNAFGLDNLDDKKEFTFLDMNIKNTILNLKQIENEFKIYYLPCKRLKYVNDINNKSAITILRQFIKMYDYDLISKEKYINGIKYLVYKIISKDEKKINNKYIKKKEFTIYFD